MKKSKIWNVPNILTLFRIALIPVMIVFMLVPHFQKPFKDEQFQMLTLGNLIALGIFVLASITDFLDGYIARKYKLVTDFGKLLDPIADKLLVFSALLLFIEQKQTIKDPGLTIAVVIMLGREFLVTGFRLIAAGKHKVLAASMMGKVKTAFSMVAIIFFFVGGYPFTYIKGGAIIFLQVLLYTMVLLTVASGLEFFIKNGKILFQDEGEKIDG